MNTSITPYRIEDIDAEFAESRYDDEGTEWWFFSANRREHYRKAIPREAAILRTMIPDYEDEFGKVIDFTL